MIKLERGAHDRFFRKKIIRERQIKMLNKYVPLAERIWFSYNSVDVDDVPDHVNAAARRMMNFCAFKLGLKKLSIEWIEGEAVPARSKGANKFKYTLPEPLLGRSSPGSETIEIRCDMPVSDILHAISHEAHHVWFERAHGKTYPYTREREMWENTANTFALLALQGLKDQDAIGSRCGWYGG